MANRRKPTIEKVCPVCKETFLVCPSLAKRVCCSRECKGIVSRGPRHLIDKLCHNCGKQFQVRPHENKRKYCSMLCSNTHITEPSQDNQRKRPVKPLLTKTCRHCKQTFETKASKQIFCSKDCHLNHTRRKSHKCLRCGTVYILGKHHNQYCSNECRSAVHSLVFGENHWGWKGGPIKYGPNWKRQKSKALKRDNYICRACGSTQDLHVHHIKPSRTFDGDWRTANVLSNLITLCHPCHKNVEYGKLPCPGQIVALNDIRYGRHNL